MELSKGCFTIFCDERAPLGIFHGAWKLAGDYEFSGSRSKPVMQFKRQRYYYKVMIGLRHSIIDIDKNENKSLSANPDTFRILNNWLVENMLCSTHISCEGEQRLLSNIWDIYFESKEDALMSIMRFK